MALTTLFPAETADARITAETLASLYNWSGKDSVALNIVTTLNGSLTDTEGTSDGLSNPDDRKILGVIRSHADVIVVGASTARAEQYTSPTGSALALVTKTGDVSGMAISRWNETIVIAPSGVVISDDALAATVLRVGARSEGPGAHEIISALRSAGFSQILCEGGGALAKAFGMSGLLTDVFLSYSAQLVGGGVSWLAESNRAENAISLALRHLIHDTTTDALYTRWAPRALGH